MTKSLPNKITTLVGALAVALLMPMFAQAQTPSTNDENRDNDWAHVNQLTQEIGETELEFINPRGFASCFEYRTDGDISQVIATNGGVNFNPAITDGLYPFTCENDSSSTMLIEADEYVEVRSVFGAESDERFDWTRFDVLEAPFERSLEITEPATDGETFAGTVDFAATYVDEDGNDDVAWAVRVGTCAPNDDFTVAGNVGGFDNSFSWDGNSFSASVDMSGLDDGSYCFIINPRDDNDEDDLRETRQFELDNPDTVAPIVTIESPSDGDSVSGMVTVVGTIEEDEAMGNHNVSLYDAGADVNDFSLRLAQNNVPNSSIFTNEEIWNFDSTAFDNGDYQLRFAARDAAGNRDLSNPDTGGDSSVHVITITIDNDLDGDGIPQSMDRCLDSEADDFDDKSKGRYYYDGEEWQSTGKGAKNFEPDMEYTYGCSGQQILEAIREATGDEMKGHFKFGPSKSMLEAWHAGEYEGTSLF